MKIISKYKDYYDYLCGIEGIDNKVVLDRREGFVLDKFYPGITPYEQITLAICGTLYRGLRNKDRYFWLKELKKCGKYRRDYFTGEYKVTYNSGYRFKNHIGIEPKETDINDKENCPIVFVHGSSDQHRQIFPMLRELEIPRMYSAEKIYQDIYNWLSERNEKHVVDNRTDIEKVESAGFDKKTSFRNM